MRLFAKFLAISGICIAIFAVILNILIDNPYTHRVLRAAIDEKVREHTHLTSLEFNAIKVSVLPPSIDLFGLSVAPAANPKRPILSASHARTRVSLWALLMGDLRLAVAETTDMVVVWPPPWDFPGFLKEPASPEPEQPEKQATWPPEWDLPLDRIRMTNAQFFVDATIEDAVPLRPQWISAAVIGANLDLSYSSWAEIEGFLEINNLNVAKNSDSLVEDGLIRVAFSMDQQQLTFSTLNIDSQRLNLQGSAIATFEQQEIPKRQAVLEIAKLKNPLKPRVLDAIKITTAAKVSGDFSILGTYLEIGDTRGNVQGDLQADAFLPFDDREATFDISGEGKIDQGYLYGFALYDSKASFEIDANQIRFPSFEILIGEESFGKGSGHLNFDDAISYEFNAAPDKLHLIDLLKVFDVNFDVFDTAMTSQDLKIVGKGDPFSMTVEANALFDQVTLPATPYDRSRFPTVPVCQLDVKLGVNSERLTFNNSQGYCYLPKGEGGPSNDIAHSPVKVNGKIPFTPNEDMDLRITSPSINSQLGQHFATIPISGIGTLQTSIYGPLDKLRIDNQFYFENFSLFEANIRKFSGLAYYEDGTLKWEDIQTRFGSNAFMKLTKGSLTIAEPMTISTEINGKNIPAANITDLFANFAPDQELGFAIPKIRGKLSGPLLHPLALQGHLGITLSRFKLQKEVLADTIRAKITSDEKGWKSDYLNARKGSLALIATLDHQRAFPFLYEEARDSGEIWTSLGAHPDDEITFEFNTETWDESDDVDDVEQSGEVDIPLSRIRERDHLAALPFAGPYLKNAKLKGLLHFKGRFRGKTDDIQGTFEGSVDEPKIFDAPIAPVQARGFIRGSKIDMVINHGGNSLEGRLSLDLLKRNVPYEWFFRFNRMDLRSLGTEIFYKDPRNYAYISADWRMKGEFGNWWHSTGEINFRDVRAKYVQNLGGSAGKKALEITQTEPVTLEMNRDGWKFRDDRELYLKGRYLGLRLALQNTNPPDNLGISLTGIGDMQILKELIQDIDTATGKIKVAANISGPATNPDIALNIDDLKDNPFIADSWNPVKIGVASIRPPFRNVQIKMKLEDGVLVVDRVQASKGGGTIAANGAINLFGDAEEEKTRLDINFQEALFITPVAVLKNFETQMSGDLWITGAETPYLLSGELNITRSRSTREVDVQKEIIEALQKQSLQTASLDEEPSVKFDFSIKADETINIHNRNMRGILSADLRIRGDNVNPIVLGQVEVNRGTFTYKQDFEITRGIVTFDDPVRPDPALDILAVSDVGSYRVSITITGRASNPTIEYSVDPPVRENGTPISKLEILVLLSKGDLPVEGRSFSDSQGAAASEVANIILGTFEDPVEKFFDLSGGSFIRNVYFDTYPNEEGAPEVRLNMPLDLGEDFDVVIRGNQDRREVASVYDIHDNITLSGSVEQTTGEEAATEEERGPADAAANLRFRFRFE